MYSVEGAKKPCVACGKPTAFVRPVVGPRGGQHGVERVCPSCGEQGLLRADSPSTPQAGKGKGENPVTVRAVCAEQKAAAA